MKKIGIVVLGFILAAVPFFFSPSVHAYTSPGKPTGFVNDFAGIIPASDKTVLETTLTNFQKQTGNEIAIVTIPTLEDETIESYEVKLFQEWGIGQKGKDNGLLLLISVQEKQMRIEVGYGLEPYITDAQSSSIIRNILTPAFKEGNYGEGISSAIDTIIKVLNGQVDAVPQDTSSNSDFFGNWFFFIILIPIWLSSILGRSKSWWLGGVLGAIAGIIIGFVFGFILTGVFSIIGLTIFGLIFDFIVSRAYASSMARNMRPPWWIGGGRGGFGGGGGFGGFGGGRSGGGGASGGW